MVCNTTSLACVLIPSDPNDDVMIVDHDRSVPIVTRSVTRSEHQLYEDKQEVDNSTTEEGSGETSLILFVKCKFLVHRYHFLQQSSKDMSKNT